MARIKKITFHATFNSQKNIFNCMQHEAAEKIESHFKINLNDVTLYSVDDGQRKIITSDAIAELMNIEIVPNNNGRRDSLKMLVDGIISKLKNNTPLAGPERMTLIQALETHSTGIFKRKLHQTDMNHSLTNGHPEVKNKKLQVAIPGKESFTQTDRVNIDATNIEQPESDEDYARHQLKRLWHLNAISNEEIDSLMNKTFDERRKKIIIGCAAVKQIKEQYPPLFCVEQVKSELDRIFYPGKCLEFIKNIKKYTPHILYYKEDGDKVKEVYDIIAKARDRAKTQVQKSYAENVGAVFLLAKLLDEDFGFIHLNDYAHTSEDVFPYIDASLYSLNKIFFDDILYHIKVEGEELCEASNFPEAILCLIASFFIFNIDYPEKCRCTLTVIEKVFLEANDTMEMDDKTEQWIKLLTMRETKLKTLASKSNIEGKEGRLRRAFWRS